MAASIFYMTPTGVFDTDLGGILPPPIVLGNVVMHNEFGQRITVTATSGQLQYQIVEPGDYPTDELGRDRRKGYTPAT